MPPDDEPSSHVEQAAEAAREAVANLETVAATATERADAGASALDTALAEAAERDTTLGERIDDCEEGLSECRDDLDVVAGDVQALETVQTHNSSQILSLTTQVTELRTMIEERTNPPAPANSSTPEPHTEGTPNPSPEPHSEATPEPSEPNNEGGGGHPAPATRPKPYRLI